MTIFDNGQSVREHFSVTAFPTIEAFELLHEDEVLESPPLSFASEDELPELPPLFFAHEIIVKLKQEIRKMNKTFFIFTSIPKEYYWFVKETTLFYHKFVNFSRMGIVLGGCLTVKN
jgi:hypothetical protein